MSDDSVVKFPGKKPPQGVFLVEPPRNKCSHRGSFVVDQDAAKCVCNDCGEEVSPMFVLKVMMHKDSLWRHTRDKYQDEMKRLAERSRTKCRHCGKITDISRR